MTRSDLALAALASAAVPGMKPVGVVGVRPTDAATARYQQANVTDATGRTWVIRVPLDSAAGASLEQNDALIRLLGRHVPFRVPAPVGYVPVGDVGRAAVYPYIDGAAVNLDALPEGPGLASAIGRAVAAVHNVSRLLFEELAVPTFTSEDVRIRRLEDLDRAAETGVVPTGLLARWEGALNAGAMWQFTTTPVHGRFGGDALLVAFTDDADAATGRVVAVTGWDEARVGDPAEDFADLAAQAAPRAFDAVLDAYSLARSQRPDAYLVYRARLASEMRLLTSLRVAIAIGDSETVLWIGDRLRRMDRLTAGDDSLVPRTALVQDEGRWSESARGGADDDQISADEPFDGDEPFETGGDDPVDGQGLDDELSNDELNNEELSSDDLTDNDPSDDDLSDEVSSADSYPSDADEGEPHRDADDQDPHPSYAGFGDEEPTDTLGHAPAEPTVEDSDSEGLTEGEITPDGDATDQDAVSALIDPLPEPAPADRTEEIPLAELGDPLAAPDPADEDERLRTLYDMPEEFADEPDEVVNAGLASSEPTIDLSQPDTHGPDDDESGDTERSDNVEADGDALNEAEPSEGAAHEDEQPPQDR